MKILVAGGVLFIAGVVLSLFAPSLAAVSLVFVGGVMAVIGVAIILVDII